MNNDDDWPKMPSEVLEKFQKQLYDLIITNPDDAWNFLVENSIGVIALSKVKRQLEKEDSDNENVQKFFEKYNDAVIQIFNINEELKKYGYALTVELLAENWRRNNQAHKKTTFNEIILDNLETIYNKILSGDKTQENNVSRKMLIDLNTRIRGLIEYDKNKFNETWGYLEPFFEKMIDNVFNLEINDDNLNTWIAFLNITIMNPMTMIQFQTEIAKLIKARIDLKFNEFSEEQKYKIAPWLINLNQIVNKPQEEKIKDKGKDINIINNL